MYSYANKISIVWKEVLNISGLNIVGAKRSDGTDRQKHDYYATDPIAIEKLLEKENIKGLIWENACGEGNLVEPLRENGYSVLATDLIDRCFV